MAAASSGGGYPEQHDVFPVLAGANLSRIRGNYADAERRCQEILRKFPDHPAPHSLLGEIYEDQGRYGEAVTEYQLALELDPSSETDRSLLTRAMQRQLSTPRRSAIRETPSSVHREFGIGPSRPWLPIGLLALLCLIAAGFLVWRIAHSPGAVGATGNSAAGTVGGARGYSLPPDGMTTGTATGTGTASGSAAPAASGSRAGGASGGSPAGSPAGATSPAPSSGNGYVPAPGTTPEEEALLAAMPVTGGPGVPTFTIDGVESDPRLGPSYARITLHLKDALSEATARDSVIRAAAAAAKSANNAHLTWVTMRVIGTVGSGAPTLLFMGEATPPALQNMDPGSISTGTSVALFQNTWWSPSLATS